MRPIAARTSDELSKLSTREKSISQAAGFGSPKSGKHFDNRRASHSSGSRTILLCLALIAVPQAYAASPWRFWTKADGLSESVVFGLTADDAGRILVKGGDVPSINVLDGYQITDLPAPHVYGRMLASPQKELWTFDAKVFNVRDASGWHTYPNSEITEFAGTSPMLRMPWFTYSVFRGPGDRMDVVPFGKDSGMIMFPNRLLEWNRATGETRLIKNVSQTGLRRFRDIQNSRDGGIWLSGENGLTENAESGLAVIEAITDLAHKLGFEIVAEGIEFPHQLAALKSIGCDLLQGYLLGRPMPLQDAEVLLNSTESLVGQLRVLGGALESRHVSEVPTP